MKRFFGALMVILGLVGTLALPVLGQTVSINGNRVMRGIVGTPANGQVAVWNTTTGRWEPGAAGGGGSAVTGTMVSGGSFAVGDVPVATDTTGTNFAKSKVALTQPVTASTITVLNNKTFTVNKSITLEGTDATTITLPAATATVLSSAGGEINAFTVKGTPTTSDLLVIEDAAASNAKKKITIGSLPAAGGGHVVETGTFDGGSFPLTAGLYFDRIPKTTATVTKVTLLGDVSGSVTVDIYHTTYASYDGGATHPVSGDSITTGGSAPAISSATKAQVTTFTGWASTTFTAGDVYRFVITGTPATVKKLTVIVD